MEEKIEMTPEQMDMMKNKVNAACICRGCPSFQECEDDNGNIGFCFPSIGKSKCISEEKGCICGECPVQKGETTGMKLTHSYYCTRDSEKEQIAKGMPGM